MYMNGLGYYDIGVSTYNIQSINELQITNNINEHGSLELKGVLKNEENQYNQGKDEDIHETQENTPIEIYYYKEEEKMSLFQGVITQIKINVEGEVRCIHIKAKSYTYLMDISKKSRSFQNKEMTSHELIEKVMEDYPSSSQKITIPDEPINALVVQYQETDWEFLRRFVSRYNQGLFPAIEYNKIYYFVGTPDPAVENEPEITNYTIYKDLDLYEHMKENHTDKVNEVDFIVYEFEAFEIFKLGYHMMFQGHPFYINAVHHYLKDKQGMLNNKYQMQLIDGLKQKKLYNENIIGASVNGSVLKVSRDTIKVKLEIDETQDQATAYWFPYSTMSASPDGSGWYCMPEVGDRVRVYFPTKEENEAFAVSTVSKYSLKTGVKNDRMGDPDVKYLRTYHPNEIKFTPNGILISCDDGQAAIRLNKDGSISIIGQNSIYVNAVENIDIRAEKTLMMTANETIHLKCDKGGNIKFTNDGEILVHGTEVKNN